jgi:ubiquinone/menaquinone biosynthesis C-methylase UbiE
MEFTGERFIPEALKETDETYQEHIERYKFTLDKIKGHTVLDASCGAGYGSQMMATVARRVCGIDISEESIRYAREKYAAANVAYEVMDIKKLAFPDRSFDTVVSFETIEHIGFQQEFVGEIWRVLKPGGQLIISTPNVETAPKGKAVHTPFHVKELNLAEMRELLKGFSGIEVFAQKMSYHKRSYKKIRLISRYPKDNLRKTIVQFCKKRYASCEAMPVLLRIFFYEYALKFKVFASKESDPFIKPTFWVLKATRPRT